MLSSKNGTPTVSPSCPGVDGQVSGRFSVAFGVSGVSLSGGRCAASGDAFGIVGFVSTRELEGGGGGGTSAGVFGGTGGGLVGAAIGGVGVVSVVVSDGIGGGGTGTFGGTNEESVGTIDGAGVVLVGGIDVGVVVFEGVGGSTSAASVVPGHRSK
jgi:hypothetical protein